MKQKILTFRYQKLKDLKKTLKAQFSFSDAFKFEFAHKPFRFHRSELCIRFCYNICFCVSMNIVIIEAIMEKMVNFDSS